MAPVMTARWYQGPGSGLLLSRRWAQVFVHPLPPLSAAEADAALRFKLQATLPVSAESFEIRTRQFQSGGRTFGAALLIAKDQRPALGGEVERLRIAVPLTLPPALPRDAVLVVTTPEGLWAHRYEDRVLTESFPPSRPEAARPPWNSRHADLPLWVWAPDPSVPAPVAQGNPVSSRIGAQLLRACPPWKPPRSDRWAWGAALGAAVAGAALLAVTLGQIWSEKVQRNQLWQAAARQSALTALSQTHVPSSTERELLPVPEVFEHLARDLGARAQILNLTWARGKLTLIARAPSALPVLKTLLADPWFAALHVDEIRTKDGFDRFTVSGEGLF